MDHSTKHEVWVIVVSTMAAVPFVAAFGFFAITGLIAM